MFFERLFKRPGRVFAAFRRNDLGSVAIEFAMIGGTAIVMVVEIMQAGLFFYEETSLRNATARSMRQVVTGAVSAQGLTAAQFRTTILCPQLPAVMSCANVITNVRSVSEDVSPNGFYAFVNANQSGIVAPAMDNTQTGFCSGSTGSVIYAQVYYAMPVFSPAWRLSSVMWNGIRTHFVSAAAAFKNEPFPSSQSQGC